MMTFDKIMITEIYNGWSHAEMSEAIKMLKRELKFNKNHDVSKQLTHILSELQVERNRLAQVQKERDAYKKRCEMLMGMLGRKLSVKERITGKIDLNQNQTKTDI
jgi:predicted FMN-binding regulatory protein PaiB